MPLDTQPGPPPSSYATKHRKSPFGHLKASSFHTPRFVMPHSPTTDKRNSARAFSGGPLAQATDDAQSLSRIRHPTECIRYDRRLSPFGQNGVSRWVRIPASRGLTARLVSIARPAAEPPLTADAAPCQPTSASPPTLPPRQWSPIHTAAAGGSDLAPRPGSAGDEYGPASPDFQLRKRSLFLQNINKRIQWQEVMTPKYSTAIRSKYIFMEIK